MVDLTPLTAALAQIADGSQTLDESIDSRYPNDDYVSAAKSPGRFYPERVWHAAGEFLGPIPAEYRWLLEHTGPLVVAEEFRIIDFLRQGRAGMAHYLTLLNESAELEGASLRFGWEVGPLGEFGKRRCSLLETRQEQPAQNTCVL